MNRLNRQYPEAGVETPTGGDAMWPRIHHSIELMKTEVVDIETLLSDIEEKLQGRINVPENVEHLNKPHADPEGMLGAIERENLLLARQLRTLTDRLRKLIGFIG